MELAKYIDHTALKPETTPADIDKLCREALECRFAAVCVNPVFVPQASRALAGSGVLTATVVGFPLGATALDIKAKEAAYAIEQGAGEIDMVMAIGLFKGGDRAAVGRDIAAVVKAAGIHPVKVILETCLLTREEIIEASRIAADNGAAFVKTSTGFGSRGASVEDVLAMKEAVDGRCRIKASGGIRTREQAMAMIAAGATRIGTSAGVTIVKGA
ncbi:MAG: deoxyribose-phosphate aldolase [bacterium]